MWNFPKFLDVLANKWGDAEIIAVPDDACMTGSFGLLRRLNEVEWCSLCTCERLSHLTDTRFVPVIDCFI